MDIERFNRVREIFEAALDLPTEDREAFLSQWCSGDPPLQEEVLKLLRADDDSKGFLDPPTAVIPMGEWEPQATIAGYRLENLVGEGGMAQVYVGRRAPEAELVAIKLIRPDLGSQDILDRFRREQQILANLNHPNIARLIEAGTTPEGLPYVVMDFIDGTPIDRFCNERHLSLAARLKLFTRVCSAVQYAHDRGVIHRDLKPANILVAANGTPQVLDFGIAKLLKTEVSQHLDLTATGRHLLTPDYASPEQILGRALNPRTDIYSLGVVLYELLTGSMPHPGSDAPLDHMARVIDSAPQTPSAAVWNSDKPSNVFGATTRLRLWYQLSGDLDTIVLKALAKSPDDRYGSIAQFVDDLRKHSEQTPVTARRNSLAYVVERFVAREGVAAVATVRAALYRRRPSAEMTDELLRISKLNSLGVVLSEAGETLDALGNFEQALRIGEELAAAYPSSEAVLRAISLSSNRLAVITTRQGRRDLALKLFRKALFANETMNAEDRNDAQARRNIVGNSKNMAIVHELIAADENTSCSERMRNLELARTWYRRSLETSFEMQREDMATLGDESAPAELAYSLRCCEEAISRLGARYDNTDSFRLAT